MANFESWQNFSDDLALDLSSSDGRTKLSKLLDDGHKHITYQELVGREIQALLARGKSTHEGLRALIGGLLRGSRYAKDVAYSWRSWIEILMKAGATFPTEMLFEPRYSPTLCLEDEVYDYEIRGMLIDLCWDVVFEYALNYVDWTSIEAVETWEDLWELDPTYSGPVTEAERLSVLKGQSEQLSRIEEDASKLQPRRVQVVPEDTRHFANKPIDESSMFQTTPLESAIARGDDTQVFKYLKDGADPMADRSMEIASRTLYESQTRPYSMDSIELAVMERIMAELKAYGGVERVNRVPDTELYTGDDIDDFLYDSDED